MDQDLRNDDQIEESVQHDLTILREVWEERGELFADDLRTRVEIIEGYLDNQSTGWRGMAASSWPWRQRWSSWLIFVLEPST